MRALWVRLLVTIAVPILAIALGAWLPVPGVADALWRFTPDARPPLSIFALGLSPILTAYGLVELVAFVVPSLARLRHGDPAGRVRLERAARVLAIVLAVVQAFWVATSLAAIGQADPFPGGEVSAPLVATTLVAGMCLLFVLAELVTRMGIVNGVLLLVVTGALAEAARPLRASVATASLAGRLDPAHGIAFGLAIVVVVAATWIAVRGSAARGPAADPTGAAGAPYRAARARAVAPWIPVPASSIAAATIAAALVNLPVSLAALVPGFRGVAAALSGTAAWTVAYAVTTLVLAIVLTLLLQRPRETSDLASRLGLGAKGEVEVEARAARLRALPPTLAYLLAIVLAGAAVARTPLAAPSLVVVAVATVLVADAARAIAEGARPPSRVAVWQERRAAAVPVLRAVLEEEGIETRVRGLATLSLLSVFAPYAPAEILVREEDAQRATAALRHVLLGERAPERRPDAPVASPSPAVPSGRAPTGLLAAACVVAGALVFVAGTRLAPEPPPARRAKLEVTRIDDTIDPFADVADVDLPRGVDVRLETVPVGAVHQKVHYARVTPLEGETLAAARARADAWARSVGLPRGARIAWEDVVERDDDTGAARVVGARSFVLWGDPVLTTADVVDAVPSVSTGLPDVYVAVTLGEAGAVRFEEATGAWVGRRLAILVDDRVSSAPVVRTRIAGGRISITMGQAEPDRQLAEAKKLAHELSGR